MPAVDMLFRPMAWRYVFSLWPLLLIFAFAQLIMHLTGNSAAIGLPLWLSALDFVFFLLCFGITGLWVHWPVARLGRRLEVGTPRHQRVLESLMSEQPWRALKGFTLTGVLYGTFLMALVTIAAAVNGVQLTLRMIVALGLCFYFSTIVLIPALSVVKTIAYTTRLRRKLSVQGVFAGDLEDNRPTRALTGSARRSWLVFFVTGLLPASVLALYVYLALGVSDVAEQHFIIAQALVLFATTILSGIYLTHAISDTLKLVTRELSMGLAHLRQGNFSGRVPVLTDDDLGELARGLNTALEGLQEREDLKDTLKIASEIQQGLLPRKAPSIPGYELYGFQQSCYSVGGDYYDHIAVTGNSFWLIVADVAGKGYPAALTVANLQAMLHALAASKAGLADAARYINDALHANMRGGRFVSVFLAELRSGVHVLEWINAGHVPPLLICGGKLHGLEASAPPMGLNAGMSYELNHAKFAPGDMMLAYSDGVTEARGKDGREMFGEGRLADWLMANHDKSLEDMPGSLLRTMEAFGNMAREDDLTLLCLRRRNHGKNKD